MKKPIVVIGVGEIGFVFSRGFLRLGHPVYPVTRQMDIGKEAENIPEPELVMVTVGEADLSAILENMPQQWRSKIAMVQNELLPVDWRRHGYLDPTVISVWFEKKKGQDTKVVIPSPIQGPYAGLLGNALAELDIPYVILDDKEQLLQELVRKNYYILATNIAGLKVGGTVSELWEQHEDLTRSVLDDIYKIQTYLTGDADLDHEKLVDAMVVAFEGDPDHQCMGRSAPARLDRALQIAKDADIEVRVLQDIKDSLK